MPTVKYFTVEEANAVLPNIEPLMARLLAVRGKVVRQRQALRPLLDDLISDVGGWEASQMVLDFIEIEQLAAEIQSYGCVLKDLNTGLLDFPAKLDGRDVLLCWRYGEPDVAFYHELHSGFNGRRPIE